MVLTSNDRSLLQGQASASDPAPPGSRTSTLIYASNVSLNGCIVDERGAFDRVTPDDDVFAYITDPMRSVGTYIYGRRVYDTMAVWEPTPRWCAVGAHERLGNRLAGAGQGRLLQDPAAVSTAETRLERHFGPARLTT